MTITRFTSVSALDDLQTETMSLTNTDVDRTTYLALSNEIKTLFGVESFIIFRDTVKGADGRFWIEESDYAYMWRRILKNAERK